MIIPRVKSQTAKEGVWRPKKFIGVASVATDVYAANAIKALELFVPDHCVISEGAADVTLTCLPSAPAAEWYRLTVTETGALLEYADARGAINAVASLAQLILDGDVPACVIEDYPEYLYRGLMLDLGRGIREPFQDIKDLAIHMALSKLNILHLHLMDSDSLCYESDAIPLVKGSPKRQGRQYTKAQLKSLVEFCTMLAIEIVPEIEVPSHAIALVKAYPQFACDADEKPLSLWCTCPTTDEFYATYEALIREVAEIFPGRYIHVGGDELEFRGHYELYWFCYWRECRKCKKFREEHGLADLREQFYYVMRRMHEYVTACGKTMMLWNDQLDTTKEISLPKDILIQFWRVASSSAGPHVGCSMEGFARQGFSFINSAFQKTYIECDPYLKEEELCEWTPTSWPEIYEEGKQYIKGSEICAWEYGNREEYPFFDYTIVPTLPLFADRLWCTTPVEYTKEYRDEIYKLTFGKKLENDLYPVFDGILPPRTDKLLTHVEIEKLDLDHVAACIEELAEPVGGIYRKMRLEYLKLLQRIALLAYDASKANPQGFEINNI